MDESAWIERHIGFAGRVTRENWTAQASKLAESTQRAASKKSPKPKKAAPKSRLQRAPGKHRLKACRVNSVKRGTL